MKLEIWHGQHENVGRCWALPREAKITVRTQETGIDMVVPEQN